MAVCTLNLPKRANRAPFSPCFRREELCYCTEELGSESISCRSGTTEGTKAATQNHGHHGSYRAAYCGHHDSDVVRAAAKGTWQKAYMSGTSSPSMNEMLLRAAGQGASCQHVWPFPPPLSSLSSGRPIMRSFKSNGRFVLQRVNATSSSPFRAVRESGRLRLILASSASGLNCNGEREYALTRKTNKKYKACKDEGDDEQYVRSLRLSACQPSHRHPRALICVPKSIKVFGRSWNSVGASYVYCLPSTLRLLLERAQRLSLHEGQTSRAGSGCLMSAIECGNVQGLHSGREGNAAPVHEAAKRNAGPALQGIEAGNQLKHGKTPALCCVHDNNVMSTVEKREQEYAILSLSFNGLDVVLLLMEGRTGAGRSMSIIKGSSIYDSYSNVDVQAASIRTPTTWRVYYDRNSAAAATCSERKLDEQASLYHTWHTSKPLDFRIAA
ncbi:hypothetical protein GOP47_0015202 [Adiantum capillus-veneris]|uniref:FAF domain-containing protein n=1 Tax=Adiantum capillus-veneris TaxID=13818 RepID=A0A9D4UNH6_ADICA|nr:hypothetical protein GOP47_0015202 [Adiantum capillus-veneris]